jgi:hypothetical protein
MIFFKNTRAMQKANGLVSHLEYAIQHFRPQEMWQCEHHLRGAQKALAKVKTAKAEYILSDDGWRYISQLCEQLYAQLRQSGFAELAESVHEIANYAWTVGPAVDKDGLLIRPPRYRPPPPIMRDPFLPPPLVATNVHGLDIIPAWQTAAAELGIRITTNKVVAHPAKFTIMFPVHLLDFDTPHGILLWSGRFDYRGIIDSVEQAAYAGGYGYSVINPEFYSVYDRELFTSFLCRLGFSGEPHLRPDWYVRTYD